MENVKCLFKNRQYKNCSARCIQLLEEVRDPTRVHPLFMTWVSFYAAAALEETSRSLNIRSSNKVLMLEQALSYYQKAQSYLELVSDRDSMVSRNVQQSLSSMLSSIRAPIRPDFSPVEGTGSSSSLLPNSRPGHEKEVGSNTMNPSPNQAPDTATFVLQKSVVPRYFHARSTTTLHIHLYDMKVQLDYHIHFANEKLALLKKARTSNRHSLFSPYSASGIDGIDMEKMRKAGLKARAERLRGEGWKRERFDAERYQTLCDKALAELD